MATTLLRGGHVYSPADPFATAMLVDGDTVAWVGSEGAADAHAASVDEVVPLDGALVTPAFVDAHVHTTSTGLLLTGLDLVGCPTLAAALDRLERHARTRPSGVVLGHGWDDSRWPERRPPTSAELDRATSGRVAYLTRIDAHSAVASSALLAAVPQVRARDGFSAAGWLIRDAHHVARRAALDMVPPEQKAAAQRATLAHAVAHGVGLLHELGGPEITGEDDFRAVLGRTPGFPGPDVVGYWGELGGVAKARELGALGAAGDLFADGTIGSHTAALRAAYTDAPHRGHCYLTAAEVRDHVVACTAAGLQAGFHAIGDGALDVVLAGLREAATRTGVERLRAARPRIEHLEMPDGPMLAELSTLGVFASVQPQFDLLWGGEEGMYAERLGVERALTLNPYADMAAVGIPLAFGSDSPVTPIDPWRTVRAAAWHHNPAQRMTVRAAFAAHTRGGWRAAGHDDAGILVPGAPASYAVWHTGDLVVQTPDERVAAWSTDPRAGVPGLPDLSPGGALPECLRTVVRGRAVFEAGTAARD
jgi:predicted amidohydrolase YtcJ